MPRKQAGGDPAIEEEGPAAFPGKYEADPEPEPVPEPRLPVRVIETRGGSSLVEWVAGGEAHRAFVPAETLAPDGAPATVLDRGVPYGLPWQDVRLADADLPAALNRALHNAGIWTGDDLVRNQRAAMGAVQAALQIHLGALNQFAHDREV